MNEQQIVGTEAMEEILADLKRHIEDTASVVASAAVCESIVDELI